MSQKKKSCIINESMFIIDYAKGFGGKYGVQKDRVDKVSW